MYDTINFQAKVEDVRRVVSLLNPATAREVVQMESGVVSYVGKIGGLSVLCSETAGVKVGGSLAKFVNGSNTVALKLKEFREVVQELETLFGCSLAGARVSRFDCGLTVPVRGKCRDYFHMMKGLNGFARREERGGGLNFTQGWKEVALYDKAAELLARGEEVPARFAGGGALRVELRRTKEIAKQCGGVVTLGRLQKVEFFNDNLDYMENSATAIRILEVCGGSMRTEKDWQAYLHRCAVEQDGEARVLSYLTELLTNKGKSESTRKRWRRKIRLALEDGVGERGEEFREAIRAEVERLRV